MQRPAAALVCPTSRRKSAWPKPCPARVVRLRRTCDRLAMRQGTANVVGHGIRFAEAVGVWCRVALLSFGGRAGQIAVMHRILVDEKRGVGEQRFLHALNFCMLAAVGKYHWLVAVFRYKVGVIPLLAGCALAGLGWCLFKG